MTIDNNTLQGWIRALYDFFLGVLWWETEVDENLWPSRQKRQDALYLKSLMWHCKFVCCAFLLLYHRSLIDFLSTVHVFVELLYIYYSTMFIFSPLFYSI